MACILDVKAAPWKSELIFLRSTMAHGHSQQRPPEPCSITPRDQVSKTSSAVCLKPCDITGTFWRMVTADRGDTVLWGLALCIIKDTSVFSKGFSRLLSGKESICQCRVRFWTRKISWRRKWQPLPVSLPGESHGQRSLAGYSPQRCRVGHG